MRLSIVGTGYVGLVSGACLADAGHEVVCVDVDAAKVDMINSGRPTIHEPGLPEILARTNGRRMRATTDLRQSVRDSEVTFIAVGTPTREGRIDLGSMRAAAMEIGAALRESPDYHVVVVKSTVVPGTTDGIVRETIETASGRRAGADFGLGTNPEFLTEGRAVEDFQIPDRIVIGGSDERARGVIAQVYAGFGNAPRILTNNTTAEFIKYASNAALATMISFSNELARLAAVVNDVDIVDVMNGVHESVYFTTREPKGAPARAGITSFLEAGCGFGGSCLPKDVTALVGKGREHGLAMPLLSAVLQVNQTQPDELLQLVAKHYTELRGVRVTVLGIAFKPDTDDIRESPAFPVIERLVERGASVTAYDPVARPVGHEALRGVRLANSLAEAVADAEVVILVTRWAEFGRLSTLLRSRSSQPLVVDGRRMLDPDGFVRYEGIGRSSARNSGERE